MRKKYANITVPNKIKIVVTLVAIVAVFSVYKLAQYIDAVANGNSTYQQGAPLPSSDDDLDSDGLDNQQEMIWGTDPFNPDTDGDGFKDGEEVKSGHNPLVPGPDDLIDSENLTQQFSELAVSGLIAGDLQSEGPKYDNALDQITSEIADSGNYLFSKEIKTDELSLINTASSANEKYILSLTTMLQDFMSNLDSQYFRLEENLNAIGAEGFKNQNLVKFYTQQSNNYSDMLRNGLALKTPASFAPTHAQFMTLVQRMKYISESIRDGEKDPIKATLAFDTLGEMYNQLADFADIYDQALLKNGLAIPQ